MASEPIGPPAHLEPPRLDWSDEQLAAFAAASARIEAGLRTWTARYARAENAQTRAALFAENEAAIRNAVDEAGLSLLEFDEIRRAAQGAPRLDARIAALVGRPSGRPPSTPEARP